MTPKEKAEELLDKFQRDFEFFHYDEDGNTQFSTGKLTHPPQKQCALIAVDELIIQNGELYLKGINDEYYRKVNGYLFEVKQEIEKL